MLKLQCLREEYKISLATLAVFMHTSVQEIVDWENEEAFPTQEQWEKLQQLYGVDKRTLLEEVKDYQGYQRQKEAAAAKKVRAAKKRHHRLLKSMILILLLIICGFFGYGYYEYGNDYQIVKKEVYQASDFIGDFYGMDDHGILTPILSLNGNDDFSLQYHNCKVEKKQKGTWKIKNNKIILHREKQLITFVIQSKDRLVLKSKNVGCVALAEDIFVRKMDPSQAEFNGIDGIWKNANSILTVEKYDTNSIGISLVSKDINDEELLAKIETSGVLINDTLEFTFDDDGFQNKGHGTIIFDQKRAVYSITFTFVNPQGEYQLMDHGELRKD